MSIINNWFATAGLGMFIHWGHSSQQRCELSWPLVGGVFSLPFCQNIPVEEYHRTAFTFNPQEYNPQKWAHLAKKIGMQYAILTAKHHDGFALFHTQQSDFSIKNASYNKDIVRQFVEAMRSEGLRIGLYFSLIDWHHPDYPAFTEADKPYRFDQIPQPTQQQRERYMQFMFNQIRELLTNYGEIDIIWFDGSWERTPEEWQAEELAKMIRELQPNILISDRLPNCGDFQTPEQFIPPQPPDHPWETCLTMNESWGYNSNDHNFKSSHQLIHTLCEVAGKGGNLLLNVSPMSDGQIPPEQLERLEEIGSWMSRHSESIIGTKPGLEPWQFYGPSTRKENRIYLHLLMKPYETISVRGIPIKRVKSVSLLADGTELAYTSRCAIIDSMLNSDPLGELTISVPESVIDPYATVICIDIYF
ncbi:alpha-L-fucosidase [Cylindrospermum stagnale PCC 7417]|uniref:alpha-L-fucosidase n=1 Tax=Cylindrospermum stagnale PCC 7417 TaxID=56107 RepID=K9WYJ7_9NOST|nr:alpha-L-fucosidase [Cylindrospermum stagnale]AFZ24899.1 alpha-L-fucosidase [Cylindrospermum stagnale PCC 7417]